MREAAIAFGLAGLAAAGLALTSQGSSTAAPLHAELVASSCSPGNHKGWANREDPTLRIAGRSVPNGALRAGDLVQTDPDGTGNFCLRVASLQCDLGSGTTVRVLPPKKPTVLLRLVSSDEPLSCTAESTGRRYELETGERTRVLIGEATQASLRADRPTTGDARDAASAARSAYVLSLSVSKTRTLVKVRRGATVVARGTNTRRAVVLGRRQQVVVPAGRDPLQPKTITLTPSEQRTFKELEQSLPPATDKTPPAITIQGPRNPSSVRSGTFSLGANEAAATFSCALDGSDFRLCASPHRVEGLRPGRHTLLVRATDPTGNTRTSTYSWTIDSSQIAFMSDRSGNLDIYTMEPDGTNIVRLTTSSAADEDPDWSPNRRQIVFHSERDGNAEIYVMNADGSAQTRLTNHVATDRNPTWSPDGTRIAFESFRDGNREIYVMNADGSAVRRLTTDPALDFDPAWSPDSGRIAFASTRDADNYEIYVMNADGTGQTRLTNDPAVEFNPAWSPNGARIAFHSFRGPPAQYQNLYVMNPDGSNVVRITQTQRNDWNPAWAPDGGHLAFQSDRELEDGLQIYIVDVDSREERKLTTGPGNNLVPDW